ncbi:TonB-dependent receptor domain-containing protein [Solimonas marina]|uniref:TonB-dependent receptor n=1 Tax=Solimonas marina TaxID=2714601 RepID=A0A969WD83_9GAMM|nr:TonB-dependent receptor [Solimonas marina]NKF23868.1 TonB-dependent receptor [Solimonas marina]
MAPAFAQLDQQQNFEIAPQSLATALTAFSVATQIQVVTAAADLGGLRSAGVSGPASAATALSQLLQGTDLRYEVVGDDTVVIVSASAVTSEHLPESNSGATTAQLGPVEDVVIIGHGYTRASNTIRPAEIATKTPGTPVQVLLDDLPGVNSQTSDPFGLYEFGNSVRMRGFGSDQLGISLDGVPLETADAREGSPPERFLDIENLTSVRVAQGSSDVMMPSYHALGGSVRYQSAEPLGHWAARLSGTVGSNELNRIYGSLDTPAWWEGGPTALLSGSRTKAVQFDNPYADMDVDHVGIKLKQTFSDGSAVFSYLYGDRSDHDMQQYDADGHVSSRLDLTEHLSGDPERDALYYGYWTNSRTDQLFSVDLKLQPAPAWKLRLLPYYEHKRGWGYAGVAPSAATQQYDDATSESQGVPGRDDIEPYDGSGVTERRELLSGDRGGLTLRATRRWWRHTAQFGGWFERFNFSQARPLYNVADDGRVETEQAPIVSYYDRHFDTTVLQFFARDSSHWFDGRLTIDAAFKGLYVDRRFHGTPNIDAFYQQQELRLQRKDHDAFQPQLGLTYKLDAAHEVFANYAENFSAAPRNALGSVTYDAQLRPETSRNIDLGIRQVGERFNASASLYYIDYANRILELTRADPYQISTEVYRNVGSVRTYGAELASFWRPLSSLHFSGTLSFNRSTFRNNYTRYDEDAGADEVVTVKGKTLPDTPNLMATVTARYLKGPWSFDADAKYTGLRYGTAVNDEHVDAYTVVNVAGGYTIAPTWPSVEAVQLQLHVNNLFNKRYVGYISPAEFIDNDNHGTYFLGAPRALYFSVSADLR